MLREPGADLETDRWSGREKAAVDNDFQARHVRGFRPRQEMQRRLLLRLDRLGAGC